MPSDGLVGAGSLESIGRYEVVERLGAGGFATVYLARDPVLDSRVAIKVLAENWTDKADLRDRFIREAQLLRRIDSDRVITVHDIGELPSGQPYFVMALVDRGTLDERLASVGRPSAADIGNVGAQVADCLRVIHSQDMIHRDIKPSNLLIAGPRSADGLPADGSVLGPTERLVLGDFGLAKDIALQSTVGFTISAGTGGYAAPEQMSPVGVPDQRTDFYAATGVMYRAITGETPPSFDLASETVPFPEHEPWMVGATGQFFRLGMAFYSERRHPSIEAWLADLRTAVDAMSTGNPSSGSNPTVPAGWARDPISPPPSGGSFQPSSWAPPTVHTDPRQGSKPPLQDPRSVPSIGAPAVGQRPPPPNSLDPSNYTPPGQYGSPGQVGTGPGTDVPQYYQPNPVSQPAAAHPNPISQPVLQSGPSQGHPGAGVDPRSGQQPASYQNVRGSRGVGRWLLLVAVVAAAALGGLWFILRPVGPTVIGPSTIRAGDVVVYTAEFEDAAQFEWTDWTGTPQITDSFEVTAVAPGSLTFSVVAIDGSGEESSATEHTITIDESPNGPRIEGPATVTVGQEQTYTVVAPEGATNPEWIDDNGSRQGDTYRVTPRQAGRFRVVLIVTLSDGTRIGTARVIEFVDG